MPVLSFGQPSYHDVLIVFADHRVVNALDYSSSVSHQATAAKNILKAMLNARHYRRAASQSFVSLHNFLFAAEIALPLLFTPL